MYPDITGVILAGGKSSRMGTNKALLQINGKPIIEQIADLLKSLFSKVIVITNSPEEYPFLNLPLFQDVFKHRGPMGGIHSGLFNSETENIFVVPCDAPFINREIIEKILSAQSKHKIKICYAAGFLQPLTGIYSKEHLKEFESWLCGGESDHDTISEIKQCKIGTFVQRLGCEIINFDECEARQAFENINTPVEFAAVKNH
jgi:molybdopterin-guanine dinucleotide biosynthesis protein A